MKRAQSGQNDAFLLADKPDYYVLQDELSHSLFEITQPKTSNYKSTRKEATADNSSDSDSD